MIDPAVCIRCGMCYTVCKVDAAIVRRLEGYEL